MTERISRLEFVKKHAERSPPIDVGQLHPHINDPAATRARLALPVTYAAAIEQEVERNGKEIRLLFPELPEADERFVTELWMPQELGHAAGLSLFLGPVGLEEPEVNLDKISPPIKVLAAMGRVAAFQDVGRMLYYLTGASTEQQASTMYRLMSGALKELGEGDFDHLIKQIASQEPAHLAFYTLSAEELAGQMSPWQLQLTRFLRSHSFKLVGTHTPERKAMMGGILQDWFGGDEEADLEFAQKITAVERRVLLLEEQGLKVPRFAIKAIKECRDRARAGELQSVA